MGCDITLFVEYAKRNPQGELEWDCFGEVQVWPHYDFFTALAGVRDMGRGVKPVSHARGLPADASIDSVTMLADGHTQSWLTFREFMVACKRAKCAAGLTFKAMFAAMRTLARAGNHVRVVFCFDS